MIVWVGSRSLASLAVLEEGDVLLRGTPDGRFTVIQVPDQKLGGPMLLPRALLLARQFQDLGHIWRLDVDSRGRVLGDPVRLTR